MVVPVVGAGSGCSYDVELGEPAVGQEFLMAMCCPRAGNYGANGADELLATATDNKQSVQARAVYWGSVRELKSWIALQKSSSESGWRNAYALALADIERAERGVVPSNREPFRDLLYLPIGQAD